MSDTPHLMFFLFYNDTIFTSPVIPIPPWDTVHAEALYDHATHFHPGPGRAHCCTPAPSCFWLVFVVHPSGVLVIFC